MVHCPSCGSANKDGSKFCNNCGALLQTADGALRCPSCGTANAPSNAFCDKCGTRLVPHAGGPREGDAASGTLIKGLQLPKKDSAGAGGDEPDWLRQLRTTSSAQEGEAPAAGG